MMTQVETYIKSAKTIVKNDGDCTNGNRMYSDDYILCQDCPIYHRNGGKCKVGPISNRLTMAVVWLNEYYSLSELIATAPTEDTAPTEPVVTIYHGHDSYTITEINGNAIAEEQAELAQMQGEINRRRAKLKRHAKWLAAGKFNV